MNGQAADGLWAVYRRRDGRWEGQIRIRGGRRRSFYAHTRRDLIHKLADARWALGEGLPVSVGTQSLRTYLEYWLLVCRSRLRAITLVTYARDVRRLTSVLGDVPLRRLTPGLIPSAYAALADQGFSKRTVEKTHAVLHRALDQATHWGLSVRNPTELVSPPRPMRREMTALTCSQFQELLRITEGSRWYPLWVVLGSGLRVGEALGLQWPDVDLQAGRLAVRHTLQRQPGKGFVLGPPKTEKSRRTIYLSEVARNVLGQQRSRQRSDSQTTKRWVETDLVFTNRRGEAVAQARSIEHLTRRYKMLACRVSGSTIFGTPPPASCWKQECIPRWSRTSSGTAPSSWTLDTYSHVTPALHRQAAQTMDLVLRRATDDLG